MSEEDSALADRLRATIEGAIAGSPDGLRNTERTRSEVVAAVCAMPELQPVHETRPDGTMVTTFWNGTQLIFPPASDDPNAIMFEVRHPDRDRQ